MPNTICALSFNLNLALSFNQVASLLPAPTKVTSFWKLEVFKTSKVLLASIAPPNVEIPPVTFRPPASISILFVDVVTPVISIPSPLVSNFFELAANNSIAASFLARKYVTSSSLFFNKKPLLSASPESILKNPVSFSFLITAELSEVW